MLDFGALPPEINSGRMYVGAGAGPLLSAAAAWDELAAELQSTAASYGSTIEGLTVGPWTGPSSTAMAAAAATASQLSPFIEPPKTTNDSGSAMQAAAVAQSGTVSGSNTASQLSQLVTATPSALQSLATGTTTSTTASNAASTGTSLTVPSAITNWNEFWSVANGPFSPLSWSTIPGGPFLSFGQAYAWGQNGQGAAAYLSGPKAISGALAPLSGGAKPMLSS